ncbi:MAG: hypothetical protein MOB07_15685 [Acidobacteria bacterium]|nr:hypothetical protein [Acidobacteriota bacterium]
MKMLSKIRVFEWMAAMTLMMGLAVVAFPQSGSDSKESSKASAKKVSQMAVTVEGELQVLDGEGSGSKDGMKPLGLKVMKATDAKGSELANLKGQTLKLAMSAKTKALAAKHSGGEKLMIKGSLNPQAKILTVNAFKVGGGAGSDSK